MPTELEVPANFPAHLLILYRAGRGLPAYLEVAPDKYVALDQATPEQVIEAAQLHEAVARAHRREAEALRSYARGETELAEQS